MRNEIEASERRLRLSGFYTKIPTGPTVFLESLIVYLGMKSSLQRAEMV